MFRWSREFSNKGTQKTVFHFFFVVVSNQPRLVTCPLVHPKILGVINERYEKS